MFRKTLAVLCCALLCSQPVMAFERGELLVWINSDKGFNGLAEVGRRFEQETGIPVTVETPDDLTSQYDHYGYSAKAPDIVIWPHDRFGSWINEGHLTPIEPSETIRDSIAPFAWQAVSVGERVYGYPIAMEVVSLLYNRQLVETPPRTLKDVAALDRRLKKQGIDAISWDYRNVYFSWPILAGSGGYSFGAEGFVYDLSDVGVATEGAIEAVTGIRSMIEQGVLAGDADYGSMMEGFKAGDVAMIINGPWAWSELRDAGIDVGIADVPTTTGEPGRPFVGVLAAGISAVSTNQGIARQFLEDYLLTEQGLHAVNNDKPLGAVAHLDVVNTLREDPFIDHTFRSASRGEIMPNIPEMKRFWDLMTHRFSSMLSGEDAVRPTLMEAATRLQRLDEMRGWTRRHYVTN
ncbi:MULTISPECIES: maltose/maltodextrin ABC transporter substrate-binding protein MalE [Marinobacter]|jgi:maltose/maltodextrin transport system substrate-binding protein|uniref:maltose/maltodextrin ABC transporter substrate-binding protein MalE n=1 Tax=Marinobacter TaxID=2742 RepID=UPI0007D975DC|nr:MULTISPECIES: maltose/maltodextrin ABC transporter substrate-binding protein MalE [unclassified Marinobacter]MBL3825939.1 maltose/maltodextrin ABC transporter substrate-binding protein MalE [Marinobacter sp. MC3]MBL3894486.1 maltose/maltodextrin ABC transporter substrate-binding protein MalE [Marinobacter sp. MW3]OAN89745.1 maltose ABC transporter substrate-binding protein MalE [Marinobacter sp. EhC06]OAN94071.1 maltose ABC transporter substrate-binding protein MalE [Marinobacter sp. EhN04]